MKQFVRVSLLAMAVLVTASSAAADEVNWSKDLPTAFAVAKEKQKVIMICVNAKFVSGRKTEEPANKGLREVVYKNASVVAKSREFVCVLFTPSSGSQEFGELRLLGIEGDIVSPQHIFVHPKGDKILVRKQYWSHGKGEAAVKALIALMDQALAKYANPDAEAPKADDPATPKGPPSGEGRAAWIQERMREVVEGSNKEREEAVASLTRNDKDRDCITPLIALLAEHKKNTAMMVDVIRGLGRDKLHDADEAIAAFLVHKEEVIRGNAAVSLEYIGSQSPKVISALRKAVGKEKNEDIASHMYRALGRCGVEDSKTRSLLLKKCSSAKTEFASYGPAIGLAYFERDKKAARGMEKLIKKVGVPGGRRGGGQNTVKRSVFCWTLANIGDPKSGPFMREEMAGKLANTKAFWAAPLKNFYLAVARKCEGEDEAIVGIAQGVRGAVGFAKGFNPERYDREARSMMDEYRKGRDDAGFTPRGDYLLGEGRNRSD
ncbi:MAG: HEAT repeat domain-containing protein [Planctomycetota bacterium]|jgi:hypothetical protein